MSKRKNKKAGRKRVSNQKTPKQEVEPQPSISSHKNILLEVLALFSLALLTCLIYSNTFDSPFIFDDQTSITENQHIRITQLTFDQLKEAAFESPSGNRPLSNLSFALNHYVHGYERFGYHLVNLIIHITTGILFYFLAKSTLNLPSLRKNYESYTWIPFLAAFIWLVHPTHIESVTYIVQRMTSLATLFYTLSFLLYVRARLAVGKQKKWALFVGCALCGILAATSKEIAVTLPFFILLYEWMFFRNLDKAWLKRQVVPLTGIAAVLLILAFAYLGTNPYEALMGSYSARSFTPLERVLTEFRVVIFYLSLLVFPHPSRLTLDYDFSISHSLIDPVTTLLSLLTIIAAVWIAVFLTKKNRLSAFAIFWFFGALVLESSIISLEIIFVHRTYLPFLFLILGIVALASQQIRSQALFITLLTTTGLLFSFWTYQGNKVWRDKVTLWTHAATMSPGKARPHSNLGNALREHGKTNEALASYQKALAIKPDYADAHNNAGLTFAELGKKQKAIEHYQKALAIEPNSHDVNYNLGIALADLGKKQEAVEHYQKALATKPNDAKAHYNLGLTFADLNKNQEAIKHYQKALSIEPDKVDAHVNLGVVLASLGQSDAARHHYNEALKINPTHDGALNNLGQLTGDRGNAAQAAKHYQESIRRNPQNQQAYNNLGSLAEKEGKLADAIKYYNDALRIDPDFAVAHYNLGNVLAAQGKFEQAVKHYRNAVRIQPDYTGAHNNLALASIQLGRLDTAIQHLLEVTRIEPTRVEANYNIGLLMLQQGRFRQAADQFTQVLAAKPDHAAAKEKLEQCQQQLNAIR